MVYLHRVSGVSPETTPRQHRAVISSPYAVFKASEQPDYVVSYVVSTGREPEPKTGEGNKRGERAADSRGDSDARQWNRQSTGSPVIG